MCSCFLRMESKACMRFSPWAVSTKRRHFTPPKFITTKFNYHNPQRVWNRDQQRILNRHWCVLTAGSVQHVEKRAQHYLDWTVHRMWMHVIKQKMYQMIDGVKPIYWIHSMRLDTFHLEIPFRTNRNKIQTLTRSVSIFASSFVHITCLLEKVSMITCALMLSALETALTLTELGPSSTACTLQRQLYTLSLSFSWFPVSI